jgi:catechol 2,3-dioxygenase
MTAPGPIHPDTRIGAVHLTVADLPGMVRFYTERIGLALHGQRGNMAALGAGGDDLLVLHGDPAAPPAPRTAGLYHFAVLLPSREALARALVHLVETGTPLTGAADHGVSEALYLEDPEGNGVELYRDRPRNEWPYAEGRLNMVTEPLDALDLAQAAAGRRAGAPPETAIGHVHLHVSELPPAEAFYRDALGFELTQHYGTQAAFFGAGGYHHHVGANTWLGVGTPPPPLGARGLRRVELRFPDERERDRALGRVRAAGAEVTESDEGPLATDPSGHALLLASCTNPSLRRFHSS